MTTQTIDKQHPETVRIRINRDWRWAISSLAMGVFAWLMVPFATGASHVTFKDATTWFNIPELVLPGRLTIVVLALVCTAGAAYCTFATIKIGKAPAWLAGIIGTLFIVALLVFVSTGSSDRHLPVMSLLSSTLALGVPLVFGALSGLVCERTGIINIAIEGQLLMGAFLGAVVASTSGSVYAGLLGAPLAGMLLAALLALFTIRYRVDHIIVGVVLNMLALGITSFLFGSWLRPNEDTLNHPTELPKLPIPLLCDIPVIGPLLFKQNLLVYLMYLIVIGLNFALFHSRWGLRSRACGEHPRAADTVGVKVNLYRWRNTLLGGALAGLGGAAFTIGSGLAFTKDISAGNGFIALAAMILAKWNPVGALCTALLFAFSTALGYTMQSLGSSIPNEFLLMIPYIVTILAVAGFVGKVRPPAMEGKPYPL